MSVQKISRQHLAAMVQNEFEHTATSEEVAYLESHLQEWHTALRAWIEHLTEQIEALEKVHAQEEDRYAREKLRVQIKLLKRQNYKINAHIGMVKLAMKSQNRHVNQHEKKTHAYRAGWIDAAYYMRRLLEDGTLTLEQAFILCKQKGKVSSYSGEESKGAI